MPEPMMELMPEPMLELILVLALPDALLPGHFLPHK